MHKVEFCIITCDSNLYNAAVVLRENILRKPLGLSFSSEELEAEKDHIQVVGIVDSKVCATAVLVQHDESTYKMQRVAIREGLQGTGIGSKMLKFCEEYAVKHDVRQIYCHARDSAVQFYLKNGYVTEGEAFYENTILHIKMLKVL